MGSRFKRFLPLYMVMILSVSFFLSLFFVVRCKGQEASFNVEVGDINYSELVEAVNVSALEEHVGYLSRDMFLEYGIQPTRAVGYAGNNLTAEYIHDFFVENGLTNVSYQEFPLVDCIDYGANITVEGLKTITLYPILPNLVCPSTTPPEGIEGRIVYVGSGTIEEFDGKPVNRSLVLLDWNSRNRWITAAKYGAKAVIFLPPSEYLLDINHFMSSEGYGEEKYLPKTPYNFPRFFVNGTDSEILFNNQNQEARIVSTQRWKNVTTRNVIGYVEGENPNVIVVVSSYYDSYSVAPSFAPGAQEATGLAGLLEIAKYVAKPENKPKNTILFVAFSGHSRCCQGSYVFFRDYRSWHAVGGPYETIGDKIVYNINLDFSTGTNTCFLSVLEGATHVADGGSNIAGEGNPKSAETWKGGATIVNGIIKGLFEAKPYGEEYDVALDSHLEGLGYVQGWYGQYQSWKDMHYDHAWAIVSYTGGFTVTTAYDARPFYCSPFDTFERVNFDNLRTLVQVANVIINGFVNVDSEKLENAFIERVSRKENLRSPESHLWADAFLQVGYWNMETAWYTEIPNAIFVGLSLESGSGDGTEVMSYDYGGLVRYKKILFSDENGGVWEDPVCQIGEQSFFWASGNKPSWISAWIINETTGNVMMAPDYGEHMKLGASVLDVWEPPTAPSIGGSGFLTIFNCSTIIVFDEPPVSGMEFLNQFYEHTSLTEYGSWGEHGVTVMAVPPETNFEYIWKLSYDRYPRYLLINASKENPSGVGYITKAGEQLTIYVTTLSVAESFYWLNEERLNILQIVNPGIRNSEDYVLHLECWSLIEKAKSSLKLFNYSNAESCSFKALYLSKTLYDHLRSNAEDAAYTVPYVAFLFVPFVFLAERVLFSWKGVKKALSIILIFSFLIVAFSFLHPGFVLASSPYMIVLGISILILSIPLVTILFYYFYDHIQVVRFTRMGKHDRGVSALTGIDNAFLTGTEQVKRYRLRSILNLVAIIILVAGLVSFTSISTIQTITALPSSGQAVYEGLYIRKDRWGDKSQTGYEIPDYFLTTVQQIAGSDTIIVPRAWRYNLFKTFQPVLSRKVGFKISCGDNSLRIKALWGLTPQDFEVRNYLAAGRWFISTDRAVVILGEEQAEALLGVNASSFSPSVEYIIDLDGMQYKVIGVMDMSLEMAYSLDGEKITPLKMDWSPGISPIYNVHLTFDDFIILPYEEVVELGGSTASITIGTQNGTLIKQICHWMVNYVPDVPFDFLTFFCVNKEVSVTARSYIVTVFGLTNQLIPMVLVFLSILNIMTGSVYERRKDLATYSTVGLNPLQISIMFLAESVVYAILGGVTGFLVAMAMGRSAMIFVPGMVTLNYASGWVLIAVGSALLITISSSLFPAFISSRLVTPSLERAWRIPTKPIFDKWEIPLPFRLKNEDDVDGIINFLKEYNDGHTAIDSPDFCTTNVEITKGEIEGKSFKCISAYVRLFPYDMGIEQSASLNLIKEEKGFWESKLIINRKAGSRNLWMGHNQKYVSKVREQLLLWGSLKNEEKMKYIKQGK